MVIPKHLLFCGAVFHAIISGSFYGFWSLTNVLILEGGYREACSGGPPPCTAQIIAYSNTFSYGSVLAFGTPLVTGLLAVRLGPRRTVFLLTLCAAVGWGLFLSATSTPGQLNSAMILPAFCCLGIAAAANYLPLLSVASLFKHSSLAISVLSGSFDAGSGVPLIMNLLYSSGVPFSTLLIAQLAGPIAAMILLALFVWRDTPFSSSPPLERELSVHGEKVYVSVREVRGGEEKEGERVVPLPVVGKDEGKEEGSGNRKTLEGVAAEAKAEAGVGGVGGAVEVEEPPPAVVATSLPAPASLPPFCPFLPALDTLRLQSLPLHLQLVAPEYLGYVVYFCILSLRFNFFLSSVNPQMAAISGDSGSNAYTNALNFFLPTLAIPAVLLSGFIMDRRGPLAGLVLLSTLSVVVSALHMVPQPQLQVLTYLLFVLFRGALFSSLSVFLSILFGFPSLAATVGIATALGGVFSLISTPLISWALASNTGTFASPNALILALCCATFAFPVWIAHRSGHKSLLAALKEVPSTGL